MSSVVGELHSQVEELRELVLSLGLKVSSLEAETAELRAKCTGLEEQLASDRLSSKFELVSEAGKPTSPRSSTASGFCTLGTDLPASRIAVAKGIGAWISRCLRGEARGLSGREKIKLGSELYLVIRGVSDQVFDPPKVTFSWAETKPFVLRGGDYGGSIFIGLPSKAEARLALEAARLKIPASLWQP